MNLMIRVCCISLLFIALAYCKESEFTKLQKSFYPENISDDEAFLNLGNILAEAEFRQTELKKLENGNLHLDLEYGSNSPYTFHSKENYEARLKFTALRFLLKLYLYGEKRKLTSARIIYMKPFFVKSKESNGKESIEDFEIFRVSLDFNELSKVVSREEVKILYENPRDRLTKREVDIYPKVSAIWKEELNDIGRIIITK